MPFYFELNSINRTSQEWFAARGTHNSIRAAAQAHARKNGYAGIWFTQGKFTLYFMDGGKLRQKTWADARANQYPFGLTA